MRARGYRNRMQADKGSAFGSEFRAFVREVSAVIITRAVILGPLDRMKLINQTEPICKYINPSDRPKGTFDLIQKINLNQGFFAYYRGFSALSFKLLANYGLKFVVFDQLESKINNKILASVNTAVLITLITYPLDIAQARMQGDMSKKPSLFVGE